MSPISPNTQIQSTSISPTVSATHVPTMSHMHEHNYASKILKLEEQPTHTRTSPSMQDIENPDYFSITDLHTSETLSIYNKCAYLSDKEEKQKQELKDKLRTCNFEPHEAPNIIHQLIKLGTPQGTLRYWITNTRKNMRLKGLSSQQYRSMHTSLYLPIKEYEANSKSTKKVTRTTRNVLNITSKSKRVKDHLSSTTLRIEPEIPTSDRHAFLPENKKKKQQELKEKISSCSFEPHEASNIIHQLIRLKTPKSTLNNLFSTARNKMRFIGWSPQHQAMSDSLRLTKQAYADTTEITQSIHAPKNLQLSQNINHPSTPSIKSSSIHTDLINDTLETVSIENSPTTTEDVLSIIDTNITSTEQTAHTQACPSSGTFNIEQATNISANFLDIFDTNKDILNLETDWQSFLQYPEHSSIITSQKDLSMPYPPTDILDPLLTPEELDLENIQSGHINPVYLVASIKSLLKAIHPDKLIESLYLYEINHLYEPESAHPQISLSAQLIRKHKALHKDN